MSHKQKNKLGEKDLNKVVGGTTLYEAAKKKGKSAPKDKCTDCEHTPGSSHCHNCAK